MRLAMYNESKNALSRTVHIKAMRKIKGNRQSALGIWRGLGMMGIIGWSVTIPTLLGAGLGFWIDSHFPGSISWTLTILILGLLLGCANAWHWVRKEGEEKDDTHY